MNRIRMSAAAALAAALAFPAFAQGRTPAAEPAQPKLTMAQAVVIAEFMGQGRATRARLDRRAGLPVYKVTVHAPGEAPLKMQLSASDGSIVAAERKDQ